MIAPSLPDRLSTKVRMIESRFSRNGVAIRSMKKAGSLEMMPGIDGSHDLAPSRLFALDHLESVDAIEPRVVPRITPTQTRFRYFLDGAQKTLPIWRVGVIPVVVTYSVVGVLERSHDAEPILLPGSLSDTHTWLIPKETRQPVINDLIAYLESNGEAVIDPISEHPGARHIDYWSTVTQFNRIVDCAYAKANAIRADQEKLALSAWANNPYRRYPGDWIIIDGRRHGDHPRSISVIKDLATQIVHGADAETLFDLAQGYRTTAFRFRPTKTEELAPEGPRGSTNWYMRFWNADGFDARHALVRIEAPHEVSTSDEIDEIASWILAERIPRATDDPRWPTLLYPIHFLEKILKRRLASITTGWPS
jgi:hypothetical protein